MGTRQCVNDLAYMLSTRYKFRRETDMGVQVQLSLCVLCSKLQGIFPEKKKTKLELLMELEKVSRNKMVKEMDETMNCCVLVY